MVHIPVWPLFSNKNCCLSFIRLLFPLPDNMNSTPQLNVCGCKGIPCKKVFQGKHFSLLTPEIPFFLCVSVSHVSDQGCTECISKKGEMMSWCGDERFVFNHLNHINTPKSALKKFKNICFASPWNSPSAFPLPGTTALLKESLNILLIDTKTGRILPDKQLNSSNMFYSLKRSWYLTNKKSLISHPSPHYQTKCSTDASHRQIWHGEPSV